MCGIAGIVSLGSRPVPVDALSAMSQSIAHRGPDDAGYLIASPTSSPVAYSHPRFARLSPQLPVLDVDGRARAQRLNPSVGLAHRRLSIIGLGPEGHQPMGDASANHWVCGNGEIYNYRDLAATLHGGDRNANTDMEILLELLSKYGTDALRELDGMFAFAFFDQKAQTLLLARDRFGVKPLYWASTGDYLVFGSEVKTIFASGLVEPALRTAGAYEYFTFQNVIGSETIWSGVHLMPAGHWAQIPVGRCDSIQFVEYHRGYETGPTKHRDQEELRSLVEQAVKRQIVSDAPVGSFLSGGMDSGSLVAMASENLGRMDTFTGGFDMHGVDGVEAGFDERESAEQLSRFADTRHFSVTIKPSDMTSVINALSWHHDDPRAGMSYPNWHVSHLASKFVKVCLGGTGGDELFGGYPWRYRLGLSEDGFADRLFDYWHRIMPRASLPTLFNGDTSAYASEVRANFDAVLKMCSNDIDAGLPVDLHQMETILRFEFKTFLNGLLMTDDRISMAHSLETRVPFLDNALAKFAWQTPANQKFDVAELRANPSGYMDSSGGKLLLRQAMEPLLPTGFNKQRKQGFSPPDENWFRTVNLGFIKDILFDERTKSRDWLNHSTLSQIVDDHATGKQNNRLAIWSLLVIEFAQRHFVDDKNFVAAPSFG